ncbi:MAG: hypothetical protein IJO14_01970 [Clostridia bacterium]|nr:hypothetical protein [Clostridia bacterium]
MKSKKDFFAKLTSILLVCLVLIPMLIIPGFAAQGSKYPTIYIPGRNEDILVDDISSDNPQNIRVNLTIDAAEFASKLAPPLMNRQWREYCETLNGLVFPMFEPVVLDKNGDVKDNSGVVFPIDTTTIKKLTYMDYTYRLDTYRFQYDYRLDPYENAKILDEYVKCVMQVTGAEKVNILGRCEGANIALAYLEEYGDPAFINHILFVWPSVYGLCGITAFFTGEISIDIDALEAFLNSKESEDTLDDFTGSMVQIMNALNALTPVETLFNTVYTEIEDQLMPELILNTYGNMPSFWAMIDPDKFEQAKEYVFTGRENEYAGLIEKIENYHSKAGSRVAEILKSYTDAGTMFSCVAKYGYMITPLCTEYMNAQTDGLSTLEDSSLGATVADFGKTLSQQHIDMAIENGTGAYISPDRIVDASTCLYPDSTWFVKNCKHANMPSSLQALCLALVSCEQQPVVSQSSRYPQFMLYDARGSVLVPLTEENNIDNANSGNSNGIRGIFAKIVDFFRTLFEKIKNIFS